MSCPVTVYEGASGRGSKKGRTGKGKTRREERKGEGNREGKARKGMTLNPQISKIGYAYGHETILHDFKDTKIC